MEFPVPIVGLLLGINNEAAAVGIEVGVAWRDPEIESHRSVIRMCGHAFTLHLMKSPKIDDFITTLISSKEPEVGRVDWSEDTVWLDAGKINAREGHRATISGTIGFKGVPEAVWDFHIGGYRVCHKWLKVRKGRTLSIEDVNHYQKIVVALHETVRIMGEIDEAIEEHGGQRKCIVIGRLS